MKQAKRNFVIGMAGAVAMAALLAPAASAETKVGITTTMTNPSPVGETHDGSITIVNQSDGLDMPGDITLVSSQVQLTFGCSNVTFNPCTAPDPGVASAGTPGTGIFGPNSPAHGRDGTACAGTSYMVIQVHPPSRRFAFAPTQTNVLTPPNTLMSTCIIDFTYETFRVPAVDVDPGLPGAQTHMLAQTSILNSLTPGDHFEDFGDNLATVPTGPPAEPTKPKCKKKKKGKNKSASSAKKKKKKCKKKGKGKK